MSQRPQQASNQRCLGLFLGLVCFLLLAASHLGAIVGVFGPPVSLEREKRGDRRADGQRRPPRPRPAPPPPRAPPRSPVVSSSAPGRVRPPPPARAWAAARSTSA